MRVEIFFQARRLDRVSATLFFDGLDTSRERIKSVQSLRSADDTYIFRTIGSTKQIAPLETGRWSSGFYAGPKNQIALAEISENLNMTVDYGFWWIAEPLY